MNARFRVESGDARALTQSGQPPGREVQRSSSGLRRIFSPLAAGWRYWSNVLYDARRFRKHAWTTKIGSAQSRGARMLADAHFLEYGMSLRQARPGFGLARAERLAGDLLSGRGTPEAIVIGLATLKSWARFNARSAIPSVVSRALASVTTVMPGEGGTQSVEAKDVRRATAFDFVGFVEARHSVRSFAPGPVCEIALRRAVAAAQEAPSSCNRQTCHAHVWTQPELIERVRRHQAGNRTFGHELGGIAVITSDLRCWEHTGERYQAWIDGGLFAMTLAYALHAEGLGTCMLNWSVDKQVDLALRREIGLGDENLVIVLLGFGNLPERFSVCRSPRLPLDAVLTLNAPLMGSGSQT